ncbi:MAG: DUF4392 domain-containing protein [Clostridia bacterium]|nr:DUF4392 domain-containing protein [Clostridia bacterium]
MKRKDITLLNLGSSLDDLANLDPRGYGVCKLLYKAAREYTGAPLCVNAALKLTEALKNGGTVYIMTGFVLHPYKKAETDGFIGSVFLARALADAFGAKPVIICPEECMDAAKALLRQVGLEFCSSIKDVCETPGSAGVLCFTKDESRAAECADEIISQGIPDAVIAIECPGANEKGIYHNATGIDVTNLEAKQDILFEKLCGMGVLSIAIGDLGNEIGMNAIGDYIKEKIPYADKDGCRCGCKGGILARTKADNIITATVSDWGCYALIAMLAYITGNPDVMHDDIMQMQAMINASECGLIDMTGESIPAIDGFGPDIICPIVKLMKELVISTAALEDSCENWFKKIIEIKSFDS